MRLPPSAATASLTKTAVTVFSHVADDRLVDPKRSRRQAHLVVRLIAGGQVEGTILVEDRLVQLPQRTGWLNAKLLHRDRPRLLIGGESLRLAAGAVEREQ
jgi:hypothetical protein